MKTRNCAAHLCADGNGQESKSVEDALQGRWGQTARRSEREGTEVETAAGLPTDIPRQEQAQSQGVPPSVTTVISLPHLRPRHAESREKWVVLPSPPSSSTSNKPAAAPAPDAGLNNHCTSHS